MNGEIDLELYTLSIIRLNNSLENLNNSKNISKIKEDFNQSSNDLEKLYNEIIDDLNNDEINLNEYYLFFQNGKNLFPDYIKTLENIKHEELTDSVTSLIRIFKNLNKIAEAFPVNEMIK